MAEGSKKATALAGPISPPNGAEPSEPMPLSPPPNARQAPPPASRTSPPGERSRPVGRLGSWEWDVAKDHFSCSDSLCAIIGRSPSAFDGAIERFLGCVHEEDRPRLDRLLKSAAVDRQPFTFEVRLLRQDGQIRLLRSQGEVVQSTRDSARMYGLCQDVTLRRQAEESRALAASLVSASDDAIIGKTLEGTIFSWNRGAERMFGHPAAEIIGQSITLLLPPDRRQEEDSLIERIRDGRSLVQLETVRLHKDGHAVHVQLTASPVRAKDGRITGASVIVRDISELKRLQALVLDISEREQRRIGQDIHDGLSQQLSGIAYLAYLLTKRLRARSLAEADDAAHLIELATEAGEQARAVARGLLPVNPEPNGLLVALQQLVDTARQTYPLGFWFVGQPNLRITDNGLATHLYRIAQEALHNAVKYSQGDVIVVHLHKRGPRLELIIQDNGRGLPQEPPPSHSMGLDTMKYRANAIGARLEFRTRPEQGLQVRCSLPFPTRPRPPRSRAP